MKTYNGKEIVGIHRGKIVIYCPKHRQYEMVGKYDSQGVRMSPPTKEIKFY